jgi:hypothetical protein
MASHLGGSATRYGVPPPPYRAASWFWASIDWTLTPAAESSRTEPIDEQTNASTTPIVVPLAPITSRLVRMRGFAFRAGLEVAKPLLCQGRFFKLFLEGNRILES